METNQENQINNSKGISINLPDELLPDLNPQKFFDIPDEVITSFSTYMQVVINMSDRTKHRNVHVKNILMNAKNMFRDGVRFNDDLWMQHVASSIREIIDFLNIPGEDFYKAHKGIPLYATDQEIRDQLDRIISIRSYLSDIVHFAEGNRFGLIQLLYPNEKYATMRKEKFFQEEEDTFERVCIDLVYSLNNIFKKYCVGIIPQQNQISI